jgi:hypothetical protein
MPASLTVEEMMSIVSCMDIKDEVILLRNITQNLESRISFGVDENYWLQMSSNSLDKIWNNREDEVYNDLLKG